MKISFRTAQLLLLAPSMFLLPIGFLFSMGGIFSLTQGDVTDIRMGAALAVLIVMLLTAGLSLLLYCIIRTPAALSRNLPLAWLTIVVLASAELVWLWIVLNSSGIEPSIRGRAFLFKVVPGILGAINLVLLLNEVLKRSRKPATTDTV